VVTLFGAMQPEPASVEDSAGDLLDLLELLARADASDRPNVTVHADPVRGHIGFLVDGAPSRFVITDDGDGHLNVWSGQGAKLNVAAARDLGEALCAWAERRSEASAERS
jgi:hypothetical protein